MSDFSVLNHCAALFRNVCLGVNILLLATLPMRGLDSGKNVIFLTLRSKTASE